MADDSAPMPDARDPLDARLLAEQRHEELFAAYYPVLVQRGLSARLVRPDAEEVAQEVCLRIVGELRRGKVYRVPFRVVVHQVFGWTLREFYAGRRRRRDEQSLTDWEPCAEDEYEPVEDREHLRQLFSRLPTRERQVCELHYLDGLDIPDVAAKLDMTRNAVDQALFRARRKLKGLLGG